MSGTFSSLNTALTALRYQQVALDVASTNVANVSTEGYVRRRVVGQTLGAAAQPAMWSRTENPTGAGVISSGVQRLTDALLDDRVRREHATQSKLDLTAEVLARVESGLGEPGDNGVAARIDDFRSSLYDLANNPGSEAARSGVLSAAQTLADGIRLQATQVNAEIADQEVRLDAAVVEVNRLAGDLAKTNEAIAAGRGTDTSTLQDTRDQLALRLAELTGARAEIQADGQMTVTLNGAALVQGDEAAMLDSSLDGAGDLTFALTSSSGTTAIGVVQGGELGAMVQLIDHTLPDHTAGLDTLAKQLADDLNDVHTAGVDLDGNPGQPLFYYDPAAGASAALTIRVEIDNPREVAAADPAYGGLDTSNAEAMADAITIDDGYLRLVNDFGTSVASAKRLAANQSVLTGQVDAARDQQAGVSLDEETVNLVLAQRGYEAAARVMSTMDEVLDTLINRMAI